MKDTITRATRNLTRSFTSFTTGQKLVAVLGTIALLLGGFMVFRWAAAPSYAPLYSNLSSTDASAVIDQLDAQGVPYEITGGGNTVMVPRDQVYSTRISLSGEGLPSSTDSGYSLLDTQGLSTSQFKEQTDFKRAMEGELSTTIEAIDGVQTAVVHLALPEKQVFADKQDPATASVLVKTAPGSTLDSEQVQAVVHLVASSIDGLDPANVTVADAAGKVLSSPDAFGDAAGSARTEQEQAVQDQLKDRLQGMLDKIVGPGNSTVQVTAALDFDKTTSQTTNYTYNNTNPPLSQSSASETYTGPGAAAGTSGVVGPDGQMDPTTTTGSGDSKYVKKSTTEDNAVDSKVETRETAPGSIDNLHIGVVLDAKTTQAIAPADIQAMVAATAGISAARGDTVSVSSMPFDRTSEASAAKELAAAEAADKAAAKMALYKKAALGVLIGLMLLLAALKGRKKAKAREKATALLVEQLRDEQARKAALGLDGPPAALALEQAEHRRTDEMRDELNALVERQPEDVAALLRGWLVEPS